MSTAKIIGALIHGAIILFFAYCTLIAYGVLKAKAPKDSGAYDQQVGKYDVDLVSRNRKILRWLGPLIVLLLLINLFRNLGVF